MSKPRKVNNYVISILLTLVGSVGLALAIIMLHALNLDGLSEGLLELVCGAELFMLVSQMMSGNGYFFQFVDKIVNEQTLLHGLRCIFRKDEFKLKNNLHTDPVFIGLTVGTITAIGMSVLELILHMTPFAGLGSVFSSTILFVGNLSLYNGLGNRIGRVVSHYKDSKKAAFAGEIHYTRALLVGLAIGIVAVIAVIAICGISAISGGTPLLVALFCVSMIGSSASALGYIGRVLDFILGAPTEKNAVVAEPIKARANKENVLTSFGLITGLAVGVSLVIFGGITLPFFGAGLPSIVAGIMLVVSLVAAGGGAGNRIGAALDAVSAAKRKETCESIAQETPQNTTMDNKQHPVQQKAECTTIKKSVQTLYGLFFKPASQVKVDSSKQSSNIVKHGMLSAKFKPCQPKILDANRHFKQCVII